MHVSAIKVPICWIHLPDTFGECRLVSPSDEPNDLSWSTEHGGYSQPVPLITISKGLIYPRQKYIHVQWEICITCIQMLPIIYWCSLWSTPDLEFPT